jgi:GxxExxY protein
VGKWKDFVAAGQLRRVHCHAVVAKDTKLAKIAKESWMLKHKSTLPKDEEAIVTRTIGCAIEVHRHLGPGFRERIYERALCLELDACGIQFECERKIDVAYKHWSIPGQRIDLIVANIVIVEVKAIPKVRMLHAHNWFRTYARRVSALA